MGKGTDSSNSSSSVATSPREEPPELVDPITLTLMEEAVMVTCGHSFSKASITAWMRQQGTQQKTCPVCKGPISENSILPNWALRNAIDRYCEKHGITQNVSAGSDTAVGASSYAVDDHPLKPVSAPSAPQSYEFDASEDTPARPTVTSSSSAPSYTLNVPSASGAAGTAGTNDDSGCNCCEFEKPSGERSCCMWECRECGVCKMADDCKPASCAMIFPFSTLLCGVSFGSCSNWWTRTICGSIYPIFVALVCFLLIADLVIICVFWTAWSFYIPLGMLFFWMTHYFCPVVNRSVNDCCGNASFIVGNVC